MATSTPTPTTPGHVGSDSTGSGGSHNGAGTTIPFSVITTIAIALGISTLLL